LDGVVELIGKGFVPDGSKKNLKFAMLNMEVDPAVEKEQVTIAADAQTSGGLLFALPADQAPKLCTALQNAGALAWTIIGHFEKTSTPQVRLIP
jgi:selenide,water dikinase